MTVEAKTYLDTAPFIYLLENHPVYYAKVEAFLGDAIEQNIPLATSVISLAEFGVQPQRNGRLDLIQDFKDLLAELNFEYLPFPEAAAETAYRLRAKYSFLKPLDALQLGAALQANCRYFLTNDFQLKKISDIEVILVEDL